MQCEFAKLSHISGCGVSGLEQLFLSIYARAKGRRHVTVSDLREGWYANTSAIAERQGDQRGQYQCEELARTEPSFWRNRVQLADIFLGTCQTIVQSQSTATMY